MNTNDPSIAKALLHDMFPHNTLVKQTPDEKLAEAMRLLGEVAKERVEMKKFTVWSPKELTYDTGDKFFIGSCDCLLYTSDAADE